MAILRERGIESSFGNLSTLSGMKAIPVRGNNLAIGNTDLYTVPPGKRAFVSYGRAYNSSAGTIANYLQIKVASTYYPVSSLLSTSTLTSTDLAIGAGNGIVLEAGEILSVNCATTVGLNVNLQVYEFDASNNFKTYKILALSNGANTLYTVTPGKSAAIGFTHLNVATGGATSAVYPGLAISNSTGGSLNYSINVVPYGGTTGTSNLILPATALANVTATGYSIGATLDSRDFVVVTTSAGGAGQTAWINIWEI